MSSPNHKRKQKQMSPNVRCPWNSNSAITKIVLVIGGLYSLYVLSSYLVYYVLGRGHVLAYVVDDHYMDTLEELVSKVQVHVKHVTVGKLNVLYREANPPPTVEHRADILLLHGMNRNEDGTSKVWLQKKTMETYAAAGLRVVAPDLPGTPLSETSGSSLPEDSKAGFIEQFLRATKLHKPIMFGASWGGTFSIPAAMQKSNLFRGHIAMAVVSTNMFTIADYNINRVGERRELPTLVIHGESDQVLGYGSFEMLKYLPKHKHVVIKEAGHGAFQEQPRMFHAASLDWMNDLLSGEYDDDATYE